MNAHRGRLDTPAALIEKATDVLSRIQRVANKTGPEGRLRLMGELSLCGMVLDSVEHVVFAYAYGVPSKLPKARKALPAFKGGRILPKQRRTA